MDRARSVRSMVDALPGGRRDGRDPAPATTLDNSGFHAIASRMLLWVQKIHAAGSRLVRDLKADVAPPERVASRNAQPYFRGV